MLPSKKSLFLRNTCQEGLAQCSGTAWLCWHGTHTWKYSLRGPKASAGLVRKMPAGIREGFGMQQLPWARSRGGGGHRANCTFTNELLAAARLSKPHVPTRWWHEGPHIVPLRTSKLQTDDRRLLKIPRPCFVRASIAQDCWRQFKVGWSKAQLGHRASPIPDLNRCHVADIVHLNNRSCGCSDHPKGREHLRTTSPSV